MVNLLASRDFLAYKRELFVLRILQSSIDCIEKRFLMEGLIQKRHGTRIEGLHSPIFIFVCRDKDDRYARVGRSQPTLQFESSQTRYAHIENQAVCLMQLILSQERFG